MKKDVTLTSNQDGCGELMGGAVSFCEGWRQVKEVEGDEEHVDLTEYQGFLHDMLSLR